MVKKVLAEFKPDVVHVHGVNRFLSYYTIVLARKSGARVYLTAHDAMLYHYGKALDETYISGWSLFRLHKLAYNPIRNFLIKRILRHVSGVISVSESLARALRANDIRVTAVIHNGIDVNAWTVSDSAAIDFKKKYGIGNHAILFGGRLSGLKGAFVAVEALAKVLEKVPDAQLLVLGTQNEIAEKMLVRAREQGIDASIVFTGRISGAELRAAYNAATVIIVPSLYLDPFPTMNLEAFACRKPVVATKFGGSSEIVRDRVTGFIVDPNDTSMVADRIIELLENPVLSRSFGEAGRNVLEKDFTITQQVQKYLSLFTEVA